VNSVHERGVVAHFGRQGAEQVTNALLLFHVNVEVPEHHDAPVGTNVLLTTAELARRHVALHDVDAVLLIEGDAGDLVEADDIVLADETALPGRVIHEHLGDCCFAAR